MVHLRLGVALGVAKLFAGEDAADALRPDVAELEYLLDGGDEILYVRRRLLEVEEVVVDDRLGLRLDGEISAGRVAPEKPRDEQIAVDGLRGVARKRRDLDKAQNLARGLDELEIEVVDILHADTDKTRLVGRQGRKPGLLAKICQKCLKIRFCAHFIQFSPFIP